MRAGFFENVVDGFLLGFRKCGELSEGDTLSMSMFISTGEFVSDVSEPRGAERTDRGRIPFCASNAGELRGLKYAPGVVYSDIRVRLSTGVTAGETRGVKIIYFSI